MNSVPDDSCVLVSDRFVRKPRNADYPPKEFFTDLNTVAGNANRSHFGDFSIVGDRYTETGGAAHAVTLHHVHYAKGARSLDISHFISDRIHTSVDTPGKIIEALSHLVESLDTLQAERYSSLRRIPCNERMRAVQRIGLYEALGHQTSL